MIEVQLRPFAICHFLGLVYVIKITYVPFSFDGDTIRAFQPYIVKYHSRPEVRQPSKHGAAPLGGFGFVFDVPPGADGRGGD